MNKKSEKGIENKKWYFEIKSISDNIEKTEWFKHIGKKCGKEYQDAILNEFKRIAIEINPEKFYY